MNALYYILNFFTQKKIQTEPIKKSINENKHIECIFCRKILSINESEHKCITRNILSTKNKTL